MWVDRIQANDPSAFISNGIAYTIGDEDADSRGFGGSRFHIIFNDGREVDSTNLWCGGHIPERFRDRLPDNATTEMGP